MKILKWALIIVVGLVLLFVIIGLILPTEYALSRSVEIDAPAEKVHVYVGDLARWEEWTPWKEVDPSIDVKLGEKTTGVGATQKWTGDSGTGELTFTESDPMKGVAYEMTFDETYESGGALRYEAMNGKTKVTWSMDGDMAIPVIGGYFVLMMDSNVGPSFEKGLAKLKSKVESAE